MLPTRTNNPLLRESDGAAHQRALAMAFVSSLAATTIGFALVGGHAANAGPWLSLGALTAMLLASRRSRWLSISLVSSGATVLAWVTLQGVFSIEAFARAGVWTCAIGFGANVAANLVRRVWRSRQRFDRGLQALSFLTLAVGFANALAALAAASIFRVALRDSAMTTLVSAFVLQALGLLLLVPISTVVSGYQTQLRRFGLTWEWLRPNARNLERAALVAGFIGTLWVLFGAAAQSQSPMPSRTYLATPFILWAALRFGPGGASAACVALALAGFAATTRGFGPYAAAYVEINQALLALGVYLAVVTAMALVASALIAEREWALRQSAAWRERFEAAVEASGEALYEYQPYASSMVWTGATRRVVGVGEEELSTFGAYLLRVHADDRDRVALHFEGLAAGEELDAFEYHLVRPDGTLLRVQDRGRAVRSQRRGEPMRVIGFVRDVTRERAMQQEQLKMEARLFQAERLQAIGRLAGAIAHDFNNILGSVLGYGQMLVDKLSSPDDKHAPLKRYASAIVSAGERGRSLVDQVFAFSRQEKSAAEPISVVPIVDEVTELLQGSLPPAIAVESDIGADLALVRGHSTRLHQLLMNLASNAVRAMTHGGVLSISARSALVKEATRVSHGSLAPGLYTVLAVRDTGRGMDPDTMARIFEPFFTTGGEAGGKLAGIGLGLTIVHAILEEHTAIADIQSVPGQGTTFSVYFPADPLARQSRPEEATPGVDGKGRIVLVIDDEPALLAFAEDLFAELGFEPVGVGDSRAALDLVQNNPGRFDLVFTDEVMPGLTGTDLTREMRRHAPHLPVIIASGYGGAGFEARAISAGVDYTLRKPYSRDSLAAALAVVLARSAGSA